MGAGGVKPSMALPAYPWSQGLEGKTAGHPWAGQGQWCQDWQHQGQYPDQVATLGPRPVSKPPLERVMPASAIRNRTLPTGGNRRARVSTSPPRPAQVPEPLVHWPSLGQDRRVSFCCCPVLGFSETATHTSNGPIKRYNFFCLWAWDPQDCCAVAGR